MQQFFTLKIEQVEILFSLERYFLGISLKEFKKMDPTNAVFEALENGAIWVRQSIKKGYLY